MAKRKLNKWEKEILELRRQGEKDLEKKLFEIYKDLQKHLESVVLDKDISEMKPYEVTNLNKRVEMLNEINKLLEDAHESVGAGLKDYLQESQIDGQNHVKYLVDSQIKQPTALGFLDKDSIRTSLINPIDEFLLSENLYSNRQKLARDIQAVLSKSFADPKSYAQMANEIASKTEADFNRSMRIARTEGQRVYNTKQLEAQREAEQLGIEVQKMWQSTLDGRTRSTHRSLDGQIRNIDEDFISPSGARGPSPSNMGVASEDINCRCQSITIVEGIKPTHRRAYKEERKGSEVIRYRNYREWERAHRGG